MKFLYHLFFNRMEWRSQKVFFQDVHDKCLIKLLLFRGITVVNSRDKADVVIVHHHSSCWWTWKVITLYDLYYLLSDVDKYIYYSLRLKQQHRPSNQEKIFFIHRYMVVLDPTVQSFHVYFQQHIPFIDQKVYTKKVIKNYKYMRAWIQDYHINTNCADGFLFQLPNNRYMSIRDAICIFEQDSSSTQPDPVSTTFLLHSKFNLSQLFQKKNVQCRLLHQC